MKTQWREGERDGERDRGLRETAKTLAAGLKMPHPKESNLAHYAGINDHATVKEMIHQGADPNDPNHFRHNAPALYWATNGHNETVEILLAAGADPNWSTSWDRSTVLHRAVGCIGRGCSDGESDILRMLGEANATLDARDANGQTALHHAVNEGLTETVKVLIELGADPKTRSVEYGTAAECAERKGHAEIATYLRGLPGVVAEEEDAAAQVAAATTIQAVQRRRLASTIVEERVQEKLAEVTLLGELEKVHKLLSLTVWRPGAEVDAADDEGQTALCLAAREGHADIVRELLANGADDSIALASGETALDLASAGETDGHHIAAAYLVLDDRWLDCDDTKELLTAAEARRCGLRDKAMPTGTRVCVPPHGGGWYERFERWRVGANAHYIHFDGEGVVQVTLKKSTSWTVMPVGPDADLGHDDAAPVASSINLESSPTVSATAGAAAGVGGAGVVTADAETLSDACDALGAATNTIDFMEIFESTGSIAGAVLEVEEMKGLVKGGAMQAGSFIPIVSLVLTVAREIYGLVKATSELPDSVQSFFCQVATANRLVHDAFHGMQVVPPEADAHMQDLLGYLEEGKKVCTAFCRHEGTLKGRVLSKSDKTALDVATAGVIRSLGLCVAEVAADAMPRLNAIQKQLAEMTVLTDEDQAKLKALKNLPEAGPPKERAVGGTAVLPKTSTREELETMKKAMAQQMRKQRALEKQLTKKQDLDETSTDQQTVADAGNGSMQAQVSVAAARETESNQHTSMNAHLAAEVVQMTEQLADIRMSVVQHSDQIQQLREHTGLQLTLPQAVAKIRSILELEPGMRTKDVVAYAQDELGILFEDDVSTKTKVWRVCEQLNVETGWQAPTPPFSSALSYEEEMARDDLLCSGGVTDEVDEDASIC